MIADATSALPPHILLLIAFAAIVGLIVAIAKFKCNGIVALTAASLLLGLAAGMDPKTVAQSYTDGVANTMGGLAMIICLGTILAKLLAESGAAHVIAERLVALFGKERLDYAIMTAAFIIGISVFFQVGVVLLGPIVFTLARETKTPILRLGLPLAAGMSTAHGLIPPHPGPLVAIQKLGANVGKTIEWSLFVVGPPVALVTGPLIARWVTPRVPVALGGLGEKASATPSATCRPGFAVSIFTMLLPVLLMIVATAVDVLWDEKNFPVGTWQGSIRTWADFGGHPTVAMLIAVL
ncbi:MAG TPA: SLC13 family permease, partial [Chthoniobacteraceae bacterium]